MNRTAWILALPITLSFHGEIFLIQQTKFSIKNITIVISGIRRTSHQGGCRGQACCSDMIGIPKNASGPVGIPLKRGTSGVRR